MNLFEWLRHSIAESVHKGWQDGIERIEQDLKCQRDSGDDSRSLTTPRSTMEAASGSDAPGEPPLSTLVRQLKLTSPADKTTQANDILPPRKHGK